MIRTPIVSATAAALMLSVCAPSDASAVSTLLSGYGGPGAGEQAIIGYTLLGGRESQGSTGPSGSRSSSSSGVSGTALQVTGGRYRVGTPGAATSAAPGNGASGTHSGRANASANGTPALAGISRGGNGPPSGGSSIAGGPGGFVYASALRSASTKSTVLGLTGGDLAAFAAVIVGLAAVGALTIRLARLQR